MALPHRYAVLVERRSDAFHDPSTAAERYAVHSEYDDGDTARMVAKLALADVNARVLDRLTGGSADFPADAAWPPGGTPPTRAA